ncbi:MAG: hypothetical protein QF693_04635 [Pelagibacteraceae bacterium]|jgi:hypothetical protein|nr:hypothetical protein [Pelagibacteraceae bacterium]|tara:strand:- start:1574 stop:1711 length:138 start_codon:yes stop_codon:yes gene_type:complete
MTQHEYLNVVESNKALEIFENIKQSRKKFKKLQKKNNNSKDKRGR